MRRCAIRTNCVDALKPAFSALLGRHGLGKACAVLTRVAR